MHLNGGFDSLIKWVDGGGKEDELTILPEDLESSYDDRI